MCNTKFEEKDLSYLTEITELGPESLKDEVSKLILSEREKAFEEGKEKGRKVSKDTVRFYTKLIDWLVFLLFIVLPSLLISWRVWYCNIQDMNMNLAEEKSRSQGLFEPCIKGYYRNLEGMQDEPKRSDMYNRMYKNNTGQLLVKDEYGMAP